MQQRIITVPTGLFRIVGSSAQTTRVRGQVTDAADGQQAEIAQSTGSQRGWGTLSRKNNGSLAGTEADLLFPVGMTSVSDPYVEAGFGVENIF